MSVLSAPIETPRGVEEPRLEYARLSMATPSRWAAYFELAKARIGLMVLISMGVGFILASQGTWRIAGFLHACLGVFLAVVSSSALNQYLERTTDGRMIRTARRPLPSGRLTPSEVLIFGVLVGMLGVLYLLVFVNSLTALLTLGTIVMYVAAYTPLKRITPLCTVVGAIPGAAPPVLGWTAAGGELDAGAFSLFALMFLWQFPHFLAIAWIYRDQYQDAGLKMLPGRGKNPVVGAMSLGYALVLIPISLLPCLHGLAGANYGFVALVMGLLYAGAAWGFFRNESRLQARRLLWISLIYLPCVQMGLVLDHLRLLA